MTLNLFEILKVIFLGIVEGITEWLPISSTGHMILFDEFIHLNVTPEFKEIFLVVIQLGAILAVAVRFFDRLFPFLRIKNIRENRPACRAALLLWAKIAVASLPAAAVGTVIDSLLEGDIPKALDALRHLILPGTVLAAFTMGLITRTTRSNLLDVMSTDYIRTARAKGLSSVRLIIHHALGNALIPVLTVIGLGFGNLLGGMVLVETIFNWPGVGQFAYQSVLSNDYPSIIGVALLIALNYMIINTVVDILYGIIDPRVRCS